MKRTLTISQGHDVTGRVLQVNAKTTVNGRSALSLESVPVHEIQSSSDLWVVIERTCYRHQRESKWVFEEIYQCPDWDKNT